MLYILLIYIYLSIYLYKQIQDFIDYFKIAVLTFIQIYLYSNLGRMSPHHTE